jgi:hypothetical protein
MSSRLAIGVILALLAACTDHLPTGSAPEVGPLWTETSRSIDVACFGFFQGSMRFTATRDQLSASQIDMLSRMTVIDGDPICIADGMGCSLTIVDATHTTMIDAIEENSACTNPRKVVSYETFNPFRTSLPCRYAQQLAFGQSATGQSAAPLPADPRCFNGMFTGSDGGAISVGLQVDDATVAHHIELDDCAQSGRVGKLSFSLLDSDGTTVVGTSSPPADAGPNGTCALLDQTFSHAGLFSLQATAVPGLLAGDLTLRFY